MATVTGFQSLEHPGKSELRQFAELFAPLFSASSEEARRHAVAALSQSQNVPPAVAVFIASQPIAIAAPFLAASPCLSDDLLIMIARTQGLAHARAIVRREQLSPKVIDALVDLRHERRPSERGGAEATAHVTERKAPIAPITSEIARQDPAPVAAPAPVASAADGEGERLAREEILRRTIKTLAGHGGEGHSERLGLLTLTPMQEALLVRFARNRETSLFATTLADALSSSHWLAERILLDISGRQLGVTLTGLGMEFDETAQTLAMVYPQLAAREGLRSRAEKLVATLDPVECEERIEAWRKADSYTFPQPQAETMDDAATAMPGGTAVPQAANTPSGAQARRAHLTLAGDEHARAVLKQRRS